MQFRVYLKMLGLCDDLPWQRRIAVQLVGARAEPKEASSQMQIRVYLKMMGLCDDLPWHRRIAVQLVGTKAEPKEAVSQKCNITAAEPSGTHGGNQRCVRKP